jgi:hypothetical protein
MPRVVAAVVHRRRAFSGGATTRVVGDVGCGRDGPPRLFCYQALMIVHARAPARSAWWGPLVSDRRSRLQLMRMARGLGSVAPIDL